MTIVPQEETSKITSTKKKSEPNRKISTIPDLDSLLKEVKKEEEDKINNKIPWTNESLREIWKTYENEVESPSVQIALSTAIVTVKGDNEVNVVVPTKLNRDTIKKEMDLIEKIRDSYNYKELMFIIKEDLDSFPEYIKEEPVKISSKDQKFKSLLNKNPLLGKFIKDFGLKMDK